MKIPVHVGRYDFKRGKRRDSRSCPVAIALLRSLKRHTKRSVEVGVCDDDIEIYQDGFVNEKVLIPSRVAKFIDKWDDTITGLSEAKPALYKHPKTSFKPFSFSLNINL